MKKLYIFCLLLFISLLAAAPCQFPILDSNAKPIYTEAALSDGAKIRFDFYKANLGPESLNANENIWISATIIDNPSINYSIEHVNFSLLFTVPDTTNPYIKNMLNYSIDVSSENSSVIGGPIAFDTGGQYAMWLFGLNVTKRDTNGNITNDEYYASPFATIYIDNQNFTACHGTIYANITPDENYKHVKINLDGSGCFYYEARNLSVGSRYFVIPLSVYGDNISVHNIQEFVYTLRGEEYNFPSDGIYGETPVRTYRTNNQYGYEVALPVPMPSNGCSLDSNLIYLKKFSGSLLLDGGFLKVNPDFPRDSKTVNLSFYSGPLTLMYISTNSPKGEVVREQPRILSSTPTNSVNYVWEDNDFVMLPMVTLNNQSRYDFEVEYGYFKDTNKGTFVTWGVFVVLLILSLLYLRSRYKQKRKEDDPFIHRATLFAATLLACLVMILTLFPAFWQYTYFGSFEIILMMLILIISLCILAPISWSHDVVTYFKQLCLMKYVTTVINMQTLKKILFDENAVSLLIVFLISIILYFCSSLISSASTSQDYLSFAAIALAGTVVIVVRKSFEKLPLFAHIILFALAGFAGLVVAPVLAVIFLLIFGSNQSTPLLQFFIPFLRGLFVAAAAGFALFAVKSMLHKI